jgi:hypothetical protein
MAFDLSSPPNDVEGNASFTALLEITGVPSPNDTALNPNDEHGWWNIRKYHQSYGCPLYQSGARTSLAGQHRFRNDFHPCDRPEYFGRY